MELSSFFFFFFTGAGDLGNRYQLLKMKDDQTNYPTHWLKKKKKIRHRVKVNLFAVKAKAFEKAFGQFIMCLLNRTKHFTAELTFIILVSQAWWQTYLHTLHIEPRFRMGWWQTWQGLGFRSFFTRKECAWMSPSGCKKQRKKCSNINNFNFFIRIKKNNKNVFLLNWEIK